MAFSAVFDLGALTGTSGFILTGGATSGLGAGVGAADLNGDGIDDLIVGANSGSGSFRVVYGKAAGWANAAVGTLVNGVGGFALTAVASGEGVGSFPALSGDVNGDGFEDMLIAAPFANRHGQSAGEAYLVFGGATAPAASLGLGGMSASQGVKITGPDDDFLGWARALGDVNADGFDDLILTEDASPGGQIDVIYGRAEGLGATFNLNTLNGANGFRFVGQNGLISASVATIDVNGDGIEDLLAGDSFASPGGLNSAGQVEILFGSRRGFSAAVAATAMTAAQGVHNPGTLADNNYGSGLAAAGDFNGDGFGDFLVRGDGGAVDTVTLVFGRADWSTGAPVSVRFTANSGESLGQAMTSAGDMNGDGYDDIAIAVPDSDPGGRANAGEVFVLFGRGQGYSGSFNLATLNGTNGFKVEGATAGAGFGVGVSAGDINGDGLSDLIVGAPGAPGGGATYVIFGQNAAVDAPATPGNNGFTGTSFNDGRNGLAGDDFIEGLGGNDRMIGGPGTDTAGFRAASANYEWWGRPDGSWVVKDIGAGSPEGTDTLLTFEKLHFTDRDVRIVGATNAEKLTDAYGYVLRATAAGGELTFLNGLIAAVNGATKTLAQAIGEIVAKADQTTAVAALSYQFFLGFTPSKPGFDYLVSPQGPNPNNINSAYYQTFNIENRYINFAVNLGKVGEGAPSFLAQYGQLSLFDATKSAYQKIFGGTVTDDHIHQILDPLVAPGLSRAQYFAYYGGDGVTGIGTKAAMVGWLLTEAAKADVGLFANSSNAFLTDLADGAQTLVDLIGVYGKAEYVFNG